MIRNITIKNIRGIRDGTLADFTRIVVLVGPNNSGKSAILDSLMIGADANPQQTINVMAKRRPGIEHSARWLLFREKGVRSQAGMIYVKGDSEEQRITTLTPQVQHEDADLAVTWDFSPARGRPHLPHNQGQPRTTLDDVPAIRMVDPTRSSKSLAELFTEVAKRGLKDSVRSIITELLPDVTDIGIFLEGPKNNPIVYLDYKTGAKPVALAGEGVQQLLLQSLELAAPQGGAVLLEEPEAHLHPRAIRQSVRAIIAAASRGIQLILTTHSLDLIDMLLAETNSADIDDLSFYRLQLRDGNLTSSRSSGSEAAFSRGQIEEDLR